MKLMHVLLNLLFKGNLASLRDYINYFFKMFFQERQKSNIQIINAIFIRTTNYIKHFLVFT